MIRKNKSPQKLSEERKSILLDVAGREFLKKSFDGCSIEHISRKSGVSKSTIYRHFPKKEALFSAVIELIAKEQSGLIDNFEFDFEHPAESISALSQHIFDGAIAPRNRNLVRLLVSEAGRIPELADRIARHGSAKVLRKTTNFFEQLVNSGRMSHPEPAQASLIFYALSTGNFRTLLGSNLDLSLEKKRVAMDIEVFIKGCEIS